MTMFEKIQNSHFLKSLYPDGLNLDILTINKVTFDWNGPSVEIYFHTQQKPVNPPKKWSKEFDTVVIQLHFIEISGLNFSDWGTQNKVKLSWNFRTPSHEISVIGEDCNLRFKAKWVDLKRVQGYQTA